MAGFCYILMPMLVWRCFKCAPSFHCRLVRLGYLAFTQTTRVQIPAMDLTFWGRRVDLCMHATQDAHSAAFGRPARYYASRQFISVEGAAMEDPANDVKDVIRGLVVQPTFARQEAVLRRYFAPDCKIYHFLVNADCVGVEQLIALYQEAEAIVNYQDVKFYNVMYDPQQNLISLRIGVFVRPWLRYFSHVELPLFVLLELEDFQSEDGKTLKRVKTQRDYFQRSPVPLVIPVIGDIYGSEKLRSLLGYVNYLIVSVLKKVIGLVVKPHKQ